ncbi:MAG: hypothetical protein IPO92_21830 [Saprospiraceae bacterium]|nr:hypothetical protein [Saprospiraceae bacterium]
MAEVQGGTAPFTFSWSNGATSQNIGDLSSGFYEVTVQDAVGCKAVQFVVLYGVVNVEDIFGKTAFKIYPNPANNTIFIEKRAVLSYQGTIAFP